MGLSGYRRCYGGVLVHLSEALGRIYGAEVYGADHCGDGGQLSLSVAGHKDAAPGHVLRYLDRHRRPGGSGGGSHSF